MKSLIGVEVVHFHFGHGVVVYHYTGALSGGDWMVLFDRPNPSLHDGNGHCGDKGAPNRCWYFYAKEIERMLANNVNSISYLLLKRGI